jgi:hypothetical protein
MVELAQLDGDVNALRRLVSLGLAADTSGAQAWYLRWHLAVASGDSARRAFWTNADLPCLAYVRIAAAPRGALPLEEDAERAGKEYLRCADTPEITAMVERWRALNRGRPRQALRFTELSEEPARLGLQRRISQALYWGGDTAAAREGATRLRALAAATPKGPPERRAQLADHCLLGQWDLAQRRTGGIERLLLRLRSATGAGLEPQQASALRRETLLCTALLGAMRSSILGSPDAHDRVERLDSLARVFIFEICCSLALSGTNLVVARLWEEQQDPMRALAAVRRRAGGFGLAPLFESTFLREEGRLAAQVGDTAAAIRAYQRYLNLRRDPEPMAWAEAEQVRAELARLVGEGERR